jgi:acyl CoA:acetate/3-ketoacid CoA transferase alpha subunit
MPLFLIERNFAEQLEVTRDDVRQVTQINADVGVQWLFSFLSADKKKTYCLYEAPSAAAIREAARRAIVPADVIVEVGELRPEMFV